MTRFVKLLVLPRLLLAPPAAALAQESPARRIVKYTTAPAACNASRGGWVYVNSTTHVALYCNGTAWILEGLSGGIGRCLC